MSTHTTRSASAALARNLPPKPSPPKKPDQRPAKKRKLDQAEPPRTTPLRIKAERAAGRLPPTSIANSKVVSSVALHLPSEVDDAIPSIRAAEPHVTNAPLKTGKGARVVDTVRPPGTSTASLLDEAKAHLLSVDPGLRGVIDRHHCPVFDAEGLAEEVDPFRSLVTGIMAQQVSGAAASSIKRKFIALFSESAEDSQFPTPEQVVKSDVLTLKTAGLSGRKAEYIIGLAEKFVSGELSTKMLVEASYKEVLEKLTAVRGLGKWSVEMFACFALKRMDVFSTGDLGVQRGLAAYLGKDVQGLKAKGSNNKWKYCSEKEMLESAEPFAPYRSYFMWLLWRIENVDTDALQKK